MHEALVGLAFLPRSIHVEVKVDGSYRATSEETTNDNANAAEAATTTVEDDGSEGRAQTRP